MTRGVDKDPEPIFSNAGAPRASTAEIERGEATGVATSASRASRHIDPRSGWVIRMNIAILGNFGKRPLAPGWKRETAIAVLGGGEFDLSDAPAGEDARLTAVAVLGGIKLLVVPGTRITMEGFSFLGGRDALVAAGNGPELRVTAVAILGGVKIEEKREAF